MKKNELLIRLQEIFRDVFDNEDIEEWDSLAHIQLIKELESVFGIKLTSKEILSWDNVGEMVDAIQAKR